MMLHHICICSNSWKGQITTFSQRRSDWGAKPLKKSLVLWLLLALLKLRRPQFWEHILYSHHTAKKMKTRVPFFINSGGETLFLLELFSEESCLVLMEHECRYVKRKYSYYVYKCTMLYLYFIILVLQTWACSRESSVWKKNNLNA